MNSPFPPQDDEDKIIRIPTLAERDKMRREKEKAAKKAMAANKERLINMPPNTLFMTLIILGIHIGLYAASSLAEIPLQLLAMQYLSFIPASWTGEMPFQATTIITPISYTLLHGDWIHIAVNSFMLAALGTGIERRYGAKAFWYLLIGGSLFAVAGHFLIDPYSKSPLVGISGGTSALFAAVMIMFIRTKNQYESNHTQIGRVSLSMPGVNQDNSSREIMKLIIVFMVISIVFALLSGGSSAWAAHIAGLLGGVFIALKILRL